MEVQIYSSIKVIRATDIVRYADNIRLKPKQNKLGILKIYQFCWKIQHGASGLEESTAGVTYLSIRIHPKSCHIFPLKVETT